MAKSKPFIDSVCRVCPGGCSARLYVREVRPAKVRTPRSALLISLGRLLKPLKRAWGRGAGQ
jgi:hypothetical protein